MRKIPFLPNAITAFGLSCGLFAIFKMVLMKPDEMTNMALGTVVGIMLLASLADVLDGAVARALKAESAFGGIFDSLSDAVSFGVAPSVFILKSININSGTGLAYLIMIAAMVYSVCGILRLVRFSVRSPTEKENEADARTGRVHFTGLPIPAAGIAVVSVQLLLLSPEINYFFSIDSQVQAYILAAVLTIVGYFMVSRWKFPSIKVLHIHVPSFHLVFLVAVGAVILLYGVFNHFGIVLFTVSWGYIVTALSLAIARLIAGRRTKMLEEFEPEIGD